MEITIRWLGAGADGGVLRAVTVVPPGREMFRLVDDLNAAGTTVIAVTHDPGLAALAPRLVTMRDGRIVSDTSVAHPVAPGAPRGERR